MTRSAAFALAFVVLVAGCDDDTVVAPPDLAAPSDLGMPSDLAPPSPRDFGPLDLAVCMSDIMFPPPDAAGFCDGTPLAGTCAQAFFARVRACFNPAGCCLAAGSNTVYRSWESGAYYSFIMVDSQWWLSQNGVSCGFDSPASDEKDPLHWHGPDGSELPYFNPKNGDLHCPDGTQLNVGPFGQCPALQDLLEPFKCDVSPTCCAPPLP